MVQFTSQDNDNVASLKEKKKHESFVCLTERRYSVKCCCRMTLRLMMEKPRAWWENTSVVLNVCFLFAAGTFETSGTV